MTTWWYKITKFMIIHMPNNIDLKMNLGNKFKWYAIEMGNWKEFYITTISMGKISQPRYNKNLVHT